VIPMHHNSDQLELVLGRTEDVDVSLPRKIFDPLVVNFLEELSKSILQNQSSREFGDLITFAYWCRGANLRRLASKYSSDELRVGRGKTFHIAPANVPINFAFSLAFSMISGNSNIVRLPSRHYPQVDLFVEIFESLKKESKFQEIFKENCFVRYGHQDEITELLSMGASCRIIWGGDATVDKIRSIRSAPRTIDISFVDRFSFAVVSAANLAELSDKDFDKLIEKFYIDSYLFDQNACSSPKIVVWLDSNDRFLDLRTRFWIHLEELSQDRYELEPVHSIKKLTDLCIAAVSSGEISKLEKSSNYVYRLLLDKLPANVLSQSLSMGTFAEMVVSDLSELSLFVSDKFQTMTYFGFQKDELTSFVENERLRGIDRIVPIGSALDMDLIWDGYDLPLALSRVVDIR
jgi:hypothetical protein